MARRTTEREGTAWEIKQWDAKVAGGGHDPNHPDCWNQLMLSIRNGVLRFDSRVEMGVLALR
jgi:hypothetical protein